MSTSDEFELMKKEYASLRELIGRFHATTDDLAVKDLLDAVLPALDGAYADVEKTYPQALAELQAEAADCQARQTRVRQSLEEAERRLAAPAQALPPPPAWVLAPAERRALRDDLLARLGEAAPAPPAVESAAESVATAWTDPATSTTPDTPRQPAPPQAPAKQPDKPKRPDKDKELWEGMSAVED